MTLILNIKLCPLYYDSNFIRQTFEKLSLGTISSIDTEMVTLKERSSKGNKLYDVKKTYYKNVYITYSKMNEDKAIIKKMLDLSPENFEIICAGGITFENFNYLHKKINAKYYHGKKIINIK